MISVGYSIRIFLNKHFGNNICSKCPLFVFRPLFAIESQNSKVQYEVFLSILK